MVALAVSSKIHGKNLQNLAKLAKIKKYMVFSSFNIYCHNLIPKRETEGYTMS